MCYAFIERARKCKHCFMRKHDCMMNSVLRNFQLSMHHAVQAMNHHFNACIKTCFALHFWQWKSEWFFSQLCEIVFNSWVETFILFILITFYHHYITSFLSCKCWLKQAMHDEIHWWINNFLLSESCLNDTINEDQNW